MATSKYIANLSNNQRDIGDFVLTRSSNHELDTHDATMFNDYEEISSDDAEEIRVVYEDEEYDDDEEDDEIDDVCCINNDGNGGELWKCAIGASSVIVFLSLMAFAF